MSRRQFADRKTAKTFKLVYRSQRDPQIHNDDASQRVLVPISSSDAVDRSRPLASSGRKTIQTRDELEKDFHGSVRANEGEAAEYHIYFDDTDYDYMQHLRPTGNVGAVSLESPAERKAGKAKAKAKAAFVLPDEVKPTPAELPKNYQNQQSVQDSIAGFRPDLDERIREVLEALEEAEALPEKDSEDWFQELRQGGVVDEDEFNNEIWGEKDDDGWDSDETTKPEPERSEWEQEFSRFKKVGANAIDEDGSIAESTYTAASHGRIKHGSGTIGTGFSMSSSALWRTEGLTLLDDRFDKIERQYDIPEEAEEDFEEEKRNIAQGDAPLRDDFDSIMDEFLVEHANMGQKGATKRSRNPYTLDDARIALGNTRISTGGAGKA